MGLVHVDLHMPAGNALLFHIPLENGVLHRRMGEEVYIILETFNLEEGYGGRSRVCIHARAYCISYHIMDMSETVEEIELLYAYLYILYT